MSVRYLPLVIEVPDRDTGEVRRVEISYSTVTSDKAFMWVRQLRYIDASIHQWIELLNKLVEKTADSDSYAVKRDEKIGKAVAE